MTELLRRPSRNLRGRAIAGCGGRRGRCLREPHFRSGCVLASCCRCREKAYNCDMRYSNHIKAIAELAESEGVFTTAQAARMGIPRDALHDAVESGRLERVARGSYRLVGTGTRSTDELVAVWKQTRPSAYAHERMQPAAWDGVAVGGSTAASVMGLGDFYLSPYRIYVPKRFNSRNEAVRFSVRQIARDEVTFVEGLPITRPERTIFDLVVDGEDGSLVADALRDACRRSGGFDFQKLKSLLLSRFSEKRSSSIFEGLVVDAGASVEEGGL